MKILQNWAGKTKALSVHEYAEQTMREYPYAKYVELCAKQLN